MIEWFCAKRVLDKFVCPKKKKKKKRTLTSMLFCEACAIGSYISCNIFVELDERSLKIFEIQSLILEDWQTTKRKMEVSKEASSLSLLSLQFFNSMI